MSIQTISVLISRLHACGTCDCMIWILQVILKILRLEASPLCPGIGGAQWLVGGCWWWFHTVLQLIDSAGLLFCS